MTTLLIAGTSRTLAHDGTPAATAAAVSDAKYTAADVKHGVALGKARGHLLAALPLWQAGQFDLAATHAGHAKSEVFSIDADLKTTTAYDPLKLALDDFAAVAGQAGDSGKFMTAHKALLDAIEAANKTMLGDLQNDIQFKGSVIAELVHSAEGEYGESLTGGKIAQIVEYHDAKSFVKVAEELWADVVVKLDGKTPNGFAVVSGQFAVLDTMFPDFVKPPSAPAKFDDVEAAVDKLIGAIGNMLSLPVLETTAVSATIDKIKTDIEGALADYKAGMVDMAYEKAANAYLDGFEGLEADLLKKDANLMGTLEKQFKELRDGIKANKPIADLETLANAIDENLEKVEQMLVS